VIREKEDVFEISATDLVVTTCRRDSWSLRLEIYSPDVIWTLIIRSTFSLTQYTDDKPISATPSVTGLVGESVLVLRARKADGALEVSFTHGWVLTVESDADYEAWEIYSSRGERLIAVPGDGLARWKESTT
jgi:hypothetical protein